MTQLEFETEKEKWIKRGEIKTYNMTELLTHDEGQTENHLAGAEVCAYVCSVHVSPACDAVYGTDSLEYLTKRRHGRCYSGKL